MRYLGGKVRQAQEVADVIAARRGNRDRYVEPFIGGGAVFARVSAAFTDAIGGDVVPDLIDFWQRVRDGWTPPVELSRERWAGLRDAEPSALRAWAGYAASYNGKWFAGYGPMAAGRDYLAESARSTARKVATMHAAPKLVVADYADHQVDADTVVYCDPPYADTESYAGAGTFDHGRFWSVMNRWSDAGALVLVHEYTAPDCWTPAHSRARVETMHHGGPSSGARVEHLFVKEIRT